MKWLVMPLLVVVFGVLLAGSVQSISADHESGEGIFKDRSEVDLVTTHDSDYQVYLQAVLRNGDGQLINVTETMATGAYIPHEITDYVFDTLMGKKEIIIIDNVKYEKVQYTFSPTLEQRWIGMYPIFEEVPIKIKVEGLAKDEVFNVTKDHALWKIHYCADFSSIGHDGLQCIPIFQVLVPTITLEPDDIVTHQWTILRVMN
jgi:hypothetical protein